MSTSGKIVLGLLAAFAILVWLLPLAAGLYYEKQERKKRGEPDPAKAEFDERQRLARLEASQHALYVLGGYLLIWLALEAFDVLPWEYRTVPLLTGGLMLALIVFSGECSLRGAVFGYNQQKSEASQIITQLAIGAMWTFVGALRLDDLRMPEDTALGAMQLCLGLSSLFIGGMMLYARRRRKKAEKLLDAGDGDE